ncbi:tetratricopeptide repeat protein [Reichenbachiella carrageenanivorans]|uniref:Tetratricopeptide repeat protein n=1 Tax=Reichenbachiella carrageenanivorans TaxID=2979869 RepID=A0ABY6D3R0_9BACT|nr:tetratricopeptide repeat protein [Reichenbachiella carrageenanivorans]UXX80785.1 tetratricopeptide repeat protein [Reichenbachiella carrageenanivorans]
MKQRVIGIGFLLVCLGSCIQIENTNDTQVKKSIVTDVSDLGVDVVSESEHEAISLLGKKLYAPIIPSSVLEKRKKELAQAEENFSSHPDSLANIIWYGRRLAYLYQYKHAIQIYTLGLNKFPESYKLYRHRGHRYLTLRYFDKAIQDLEKAVFYSRNSPNEMESDGLPNRRNIPRNSVHFNIWYHLGMAYYMKGNYDKSVSAYKACISIADNDDMLVAATDWLYMTYRKTGNIAAAEALLAPIKTRMNVIENYAYHNRLLMYKGIKKPEQLFDPSKGSDMAIDDVTIGYGVGNWYYYNGNTDKALAIFNQMMESPYWQAFGYIAAEVELSNLGNGS